MGYHQTIVVGNLGNEPEMKYTANGTAVTTFSVAVNEKFGDKETTEWYRCVAWNRTAEIAAQHLQKGREVMLVGSMRSRSWDKPDGSKGYATELMVQRLQFLQGGQRGGGIPGYDEMEPDDLPFN